MKRRSFIALIGASLVAPRAIAQGTGGKRRIGVLMGYAEGDREAQVRLAAFKERLAALGWSEDRNLIIDVRWGTADVARASAFATELTALRQQPEPQSVPVDRAAEWWPRFRIRYCSP